MPTKIIRWLLTALLMYGVYTETGIWTTIALTLVSVSLEIINFSINRIVEHIKGGDING